METYGARCIASPSTETEYGRSVLARSPDSNGSLGIAISEAVEVAASRSDTKYALGSVLNHVLLHQTVVGLEAMEQIAARGRLPGRNCRMHRRRIEFRRDRVSLSGQPIARWPQGAYRGGRTGGVPEPDTADDTPTTSATPAT